MPNNNAQTILLALEERGGVRQEGKGWRTRCPNPDHADKRPSFFFYPGGGGKCFSQCLQYWPPQELASLLGISLPRWDVGLTLTQLAEAKGVPEDFLGSLGVSNGYSGTGKERRPCVVVGNQQKWDAFVKERSRGYGSVVGLREQVVVAFAAG